MSERNQNQLQIRHRIIVLSGKGGVGKTTVSVNLACALAQEGFRVGLLDSDIHGPNVPKMLGISDHKLHTDEGECAIPIQVYHNLSVISVANLIPHDQPLIWRGPMKMKALEQLIHQTRWGELDFLIVDSPPGTGDEPLSVIQQLQTLDGAIIVTTPQEIAMMDARRSATFVRKLGVPILGIVENMSHFQCSNCQSIQSFFGEGGGETLAKEFDCALLGKIPLDPYLSVSSDHGKPPVFFQRESIVVKVFIGIAGTLLEMLDPQESRIKKTLQDMEE